MSKELKVGIFTLIGITVFVLGIQYLKGSKVFSKEIDYYAVYDNVEGLSPSNPVYLNGYPVGRVSDIQLVIIGGKSKALLRISIEKSRKIPKDSKALIYSADLLGEKAVKLVYGSESSFLAANDTIFGGMEIGMIEKLGNEITPLLGHIDTLVVDINSLVKSDREKDLRKIVENLADLSDDLPILSKDLRVLLESPNSKLNSTLSNLDAITANIKKDNDKINRLLSNLADFSDTLNQVPIKQTLVEAQMAIANVNVLVDSIKSGSGTVTKLIKDPSIYNNLDSAMVNVNALLTDLKANPGRYVHLSLLKIDRYNKPEKKKKTSK